MNWQHVRALANKDIRQMAVRNAVIALSMLAMVALLWHWRSGDLNLMARGTEVVISIMVLLQSGLNAKEQCKDLNGPVRRHLMAFPLAPGEIVLGKLLAFAAAYAFMVIPLSGAAVANNWAVWGMGRSGLAHGDTISPWLGVWHHACEHFAGTTLAALVMWSLVVASWSRPTLWTISFVIVLFGYGVLRPGSTPVMWLLNPAQVLSHGYRTGYDLERPAVLGAFFIIGLFVTWLSLRREPVP